MFSDTEYRNLLDAVYERIQAAIDALDADELECDNAHGALTLTVKGQRWVLSAQPPVQQLWLAVASKGAAYHFSYDASSQSWREQKNPSNELYSCLKQMLAEEANLVVEL